MEFANSVLFYYKCVVNAVVLGVETLELFTGYSKVGSDILKLVLEENGIDVEGVDQVFSVLNPNNNFIYAH